MTVTTRELADAAVSSRLLDRDLLRDVAGWDRMRVGDFVEAVTGAARIPPAALYRALAEQRGLTFIDCDVARPALADARRLPDVLLRRGLVLPVLASDADDAVLLATTDPDDRATLATARRLLGREAATAVAEPAALGKAARRTLQAIGRLADAAPPAADDAVALLEEVLKEAWLRRASDVHLERDEGGMNVRIRVDGRLQPILGRLGPAEAAGLVSRVKVLAGLDITEQRAPQDGGFRYAVRAGGATPVDIRAATIPTHLGERATLRLLGTTAGELTLPSLGMDPEDLDRFHEGIRRPHGLILLCGPTGSGKTTTLYAAIREINRPDIHVVTVEDPIEYKIRGVSQVHVGGGEKLTFASVIRSLLRHDPDVVMVGEIRDAETADIALKAAMTGHLVLSTLHTNSAAGALTRLLDLGCEPYRIAASLIGAVSQRLVKRVCPRCATKRALAPDEALALGADVEPFHVAVPVGCARCLGAGTAGRIGLFEMLWVDAALARLLARGAPEHEIRAAAGRSVRTLRRDGVRKLRAGLTTVDEVLRATVIEDV